MTSIGQLALMAPKRAEAVEKINRLFNDLARETLHDDLVALATGNVSAINAREAARQGALTGIARAATPDAIAAILTNIPTGAN